MNILYSILGIIILGIASCSKSNDYEKYIKNGVITYPGKIKSVRVESGRERVNLFLTLGSDPLVTKVKAFWNNHQDSAELVLKSTQQIVPMTINALKEGRYNFELYTYDKDGNSSVAQTASAVVYGKVYEETLSDRPLLSAVCGAIKWGEPSADMLGVQLKYVDASDKLKTIFVPNSDKVTSITDIGANRTFEYRTLYAPDTTVIDTFYSEFKSSILKNSILASGTYTVISNTLDWPIAKAGQTVAVTQLSDTKYSFLIAATANNRTAIIVDVNPKTNVTSVPIQVFGDFGDEYHMTAESIPSSQNFVSPCDGVISIHLHIDNKRLYNTWGNHVIQIRKQ